MKELTKKAITEKLISDRCKLVKFIYWRHFSFMDILGYCGAYFIPDNRYELDGVFITGEFRRVDNTTFSATFALNIEEIIAITDETSEVRWKHISG